MKKTILMLSFLMLFMFPSISLAYYTDMFPSVGFTPYLGKVKINDNAYMDIYIVDNSHIDTQIVSGQYARYNRGWHVSVLFAPKPEKARQEFAKIINEWIAKNLWATNRNLLLPRNNKIWALCEDITFYPNDKIIKIFPGARVYNTDGEMLAREFVTEDMRGKVTTYKYGTDEFYDRVCDLVSAFMAKKYEDAVKNSQSYVR